ncbi:MAG TPA: DUF192 domain-containing protein [Peptococcaceae bacterium]|nr:DUF192 domain-containing protein [Peptococcaceae bacterium]
MQELNIQELNIYNKKTNVYLEKVQVADGHSHRLKELLGNSKLPSFRGIILKPCKQVNTIGLKDSISVWYVNRNLQIIKIIDELQPNNISPYIPESHLIIEFPSAWAKITGSQEGDRLEVFI